MTSPPPLASIAQRFLHSTVASYSSLGVRMGVTLVARMALARLLLPEAHGTYDLALRIVTVVAAIRDLGLPYHLVRDPRRPYGTVLAFTLASSLAATLLLIVGAPLVAGFAPELTPVLRLFSIWVLLDGLVAVPRVYFERELKFGRLVVPEIARGLAVAAISIGLAQLGWGVWSLVVADLAGAALFAILVWRRAWSSIPRTVHWRILPDLLAKSRLLLLIWVVYYLVTYVDAFIVRFFGDDAAVGQYGRAYFLAFLMRQIVDPRALFPLLVEYRDDSVRFADAFRVGMFFRLFFEVTASYFLFFNAEKIVELFLGPQWQPAVALLRILCLVPLLDVFSDMGGNILKVRNEDRLWLFSWVVNLICLVVLGVIFTRRWGPIGMAWANFFLLGYFVMGWRMATLFGREFLQLLRDMALVYSVPLALFGAVAITVSPGWWRLALSVLAALAGAALLFPHFRPLFKRFMVGRSEIDAEPPNASIVSP